MCICTLKQFLKATVVPLILTEEIPPCCVSSVSDVGQKPQYSLCELILI